MSERPDAGWLTFLFTDIVASTRLLERLGEEQYAVLLEEHRSVIGAAVREHGGTVVSADGDEVFAVFEGATAALAAACEVQDRLDRNDWPAGMRVLVRLGLHTGQAAAAGAAYISRAVHAASHLCRAAAGGQILTSAVTAARLPEGATSRRLGIFRLRPDVAPLDVVQVDPPGRPAGFPAPALLPAADNNLPTPLTSFVGRTELIAQLVDQVAQSRLICLHGPAGSGKTRLARQVAGELVDAMPGGVWWIGRAAVAHQAPAEALSQALELRPAPGEDQGRAVSAVLSRQPSLVIFDDVSGAAADGTDLAGIISDLLASAPSLRILATSRRPSRLPGATEVGVAGFDEAENAVDLFLERCDREAREMFSSETNRRVIARACREVDLLPQAVELMAGWSRTLSPRQLLQRLQDVEASRSAAVADDPADSVATLLEQSFAGLGKQARRLLLRMSVFPAGAGLAELVSVCADGDLPEGAIAVAVRELVDSGLVRAHLSETGYTFLRLRSLAHLRGDDAGGLTREQLLDRHSSWVTGLVSEAQGSTAQLTELWQVRRSDILLALQHLNDRAAQDELRLAVILAEVWHLQGPWRLARDLLRRAATSAAPRSPDLPRARRHLGQLTWIAGDGDSAVAEVEAGLTEARALGDEPETCSLLLGLATILLARMAYAPAALAAAEAAELAVALDRRDLEAAAEFVQAGLAQAEGKTEVAKIAYRRSLELAQTNGSSAQVVESLYALGALDIMAGATDAGAERIEAAREAARALGDRRTEIRADLVLGVTAFSQGRPEDCLVRYARALSLSIEDRDPGLECLALGQRGLVDLWIGDLPHARSCLEPAVRLADQTKRLVLLLSYLGALAWVELASGDPTAAGREHARLLAVRRDLHQEDPAAEWLFLGHCALYSGDRDEALRCLRRGLEEDARDDGTVSSLHAEAGALLTQSDPVQARRQLLAAVQAIGRPATIEDSAQALRVLQCAAFVLAPSRPDRSCILLELVERARVRLNYADLPHLRERSAAAAALCVGSTPALTVPDDADPLPFGLGCAEEWMSEPVPLSGGADR